MKMSITIENRSFESDLSNGFDISIAVGGEHEPTAYGIPRSQKSTYQSGSFIADVNKGGSCNVVNFNFNAHGNGTHTECVGHISAVPQYINDCLKSYFFEALLITVTSDRVIQKEEISFFFKNLKFRPKALIIRTLPNTIDKLGRDYSKSTPIYFSKESIEWINEMGILHLLTDLPSVDKDDDSQLIAHRTFWNYPENPQLDKTITELIYVPDEIEDGHYLLNLQVAPFVADAAPSKPILYPVRYSSDSIINP